MPLCKTDGYFYERVENYEVITTKQLFNDTHYYVS